METRWWRNVITWKASWWAPHTVGLLWPWGPPSPEVHLWQTCPPAGHGGKSPESQGWEGDPHGPRRKRYLNVAPWAGPGFCAGTGAEAERGAAVASRSSSGSHRWVTRSTFWVETTHAESILYQLDGHSSSHTLPKDTRCFIYFVSPLTNFLYVIEFTSSLNLHTSFVIICLVLLADMSSFIWNVFLCRLILSDFLWVTWKAFRSLQRKAPVGMVRG